MDLIKSYFSVFVMVSISACGGGGSGSGGAVKSNITPTTTPIADYVLNSNKLRKYEAGDRIEYTYNYDSTYYDGSGSYANNESLVWVIENDPNEYSFNDGEKSLLAKFYTKINGFDDVHIVEQFYQYKNHEDKSLNHAPFLSRDYDGIMTDEFGSSDELECISYNIEENSCYGVPQAPGAFTVGYYWSYDGTSTRGFCIRNAFTGEDKCKHYTAKIDWEVTGKEVINTSVGSFEVYKLSSYKDFVNYEGDRRYETTATYWYYPSIGVVKAELIKKEVSKTTGTYVTHKVDYSITGTNIPY